MKSNLIKLYRFCRYLNENRLKRTGFTRKLIGIILLPIYGLYRFILSAFYNAYVPITANIGSDLKLNHSFNGIHISSSSVIGDSCTILQNTTIGSNQPFGEDAPIIGRNVFIGANCCIIGNVEIGDNCIIGAGTVIASGLIPSGSVVVGQKYRVLNGKN